MPGTGRDQNWFAVNIIPPQAGEARRNLLLSTYPHAAPVNELAANVVAHRKGQEVATGQGRRHRDVRDLPGYRSQNCNF